MLFFLSCPVCRYTQLNNEELDNTDNTCSVCESKEDLWICLICGNIGCGRYKNAHAERHYNMTSHLYSMELLTQRVWDYAGDNYVHRLIQNRIDGKLVELPLEENAAESSNIDKKKYGKYQFGICDFINNAIGFPKIVLRR